jgi:hypothetical protein
VDFNVSMANLAVISELNGELAVVATNEILAHRMT